MEETVKWLHKEVWLAHNYLFPHRLLWDCWTVTFQMKQSVNLLSVFWRLPREWQMNDSRTCFSNSRRQVDCRVSPLSCSIISWSLFLSCSIISWSFFFVLLYNFMIFFFVLLYNFMIFFLSCIIISWSFCLYNVYTHRVWKLLVLQLNVC